jgi:hypothetical protein
MVPAATPAAAVTQPNVKDPMAPELPTLVKKNKMRVGWVTGGTGPKHRSKQERNQRKAVRRARARNTKR